MVSCLAIHVHVATTVVSRKSAHGRSTLQVCQRGGWALFWVFLHLAIKECPCHVYMPSKWTNNNVQLNHQQLQSQVRTAHNTLNGTMSLWACMVCTALHVAISIYAEMPCSNLWWSITQRFLPCIRTAFKAVLLKLGMKFTSGWALIQVNFDPIQEFWPKVRGRGALLWVGVLLRDYGT